MVLDLVLRRARFGSLFKAFSRPFKGIPKALWKPFQSLFKAFPMSIKNL
jgi:hypothetical protein